MAARLPDSLKQYFTTQAELEKALNELDSQYPLMSYRPDSGERAGMKLATITEKNVEIHSPLTHEEAIGLAFWLSEVFGV